MNTIFGIPMSGLMIGLLILLGLCLLVVGIAALRRPVIFKLGLRNIPRRKAQSALIIVGLMLSTLIITAALGTGDTLHYSLTRDSYDKLGQIDQLIVPSSSFIAPNADTNQTFSDAIVPVVTSALAGNPEVDGIVPLLDIRISATNQTHPQSEPTMILTGVDLAGLANLGGLRDDAGNPINLAKLHPNTVILSAKGAANLNAAVGDHLIIYFDGLPHELTVTAIAEDTYLSGYRRGREDFLEYPGMMMALADVQNMSNQPRTLSAIAISGAGNARSGYHHTDAITEALRTPLTGTGLGVDAIKRFSVEDGEAIATNFTNIFLILGLFSIAAGLLLIVLIFTMLAAERRSEMGMARAVGTQRRQLMQQFISEGVGYALISSLLGGFLGVLAAIGIAHGMMLIFGQYVEITPHVDPRSMVIAWCLGVIITFATITISSWKVSKLTIVAAIRDIPDLSISHRRYRTLIWGCLLTAFGGVMTFLGLTGNTAFLFFTGLSLVSFGLAQIFRFLGFASRIVLSAVGLFLIVLWLIPEGLGQRIWGPMDGDIEMFFVAGIFLVIGSTILTIQNTDLLLRGINRLGALFKGSLPAVRTAVAWPSAARGRTGMTIAMFSLIIFSLVMMATMNANFGGSPNAGAGWDVVASAQGSVPASEFTTDLTSAGVDQSLFTATGTTTNPAVYSSELRLSGTEPWKLWPVIGADADFLTASSLTFQYRAEGFATDADVISALKTQPNVAVIDSWVIPNGDLGNSTDSQFQIAGFKSTAESFTPIVVDLAGKDGTVSQVTIIGIIDEEITTMHALYANQRTIDAIYPTLTSTSFYVALSNPDQSRTLAQQMEAALLTRGVQADSIHDQIRDAEKEEAGFLYLIEGFMALGLLVGVAAIGVIAFRSVVERRQQIGVLRALGFQRSLVSLGFMIETAFIVGLGALTGTALGILLSRNLLTGDSAGSPVEDFSVPWLLIMIILTATIVTALGMTWLPSRQAGRIAPAEALRYE